MRLTPKQRSRYKDALSSLGWTQEYYSNLLGYKSLQIMQRSRKYAQWVDLLIQIVEAYEKSNGSDEDVVRKTPRK